MQTFLRLALARSLALAAVLLATTGCIVARRASWYEAAQIQPGSERLAAHLAPGEHVVLRLVHSSGPLLPAPDTGTERQLLIEILTGALAEGRELRFPSPEARASFGLRDGLLGRSAEASGTARVVALRGDDAVVEYDARCAELEWADAGRERFVRAALPES